MGLAPVWQLKRRNPSLLMAGLLLALVGAPFRASGAGLILALAPRARCQAFFFVEGSRRVMQPINGRNEQSL